MKNYHLNSTLFYLQTPRLDLVSCNGQMIKKAMEGPAALGDYLGVDVVENWTEFGIDPLKFFLEKLEADGEEVDWLLYFPILRSEGKVIGSCCFKGQPTEDGYVEIGYEIAPEYRRLGLSTEMAKALIEHAFRFKKITHIIAHTLPAINDSTSVLTKCGMHRDGTLWDDVDGEIWRWKLERKYDFL